MVIEQPIGDFELGIGVFKIGDWSFYHHLVISTFSSLLSTGAILVVPRDFLYN